MVGEKWTTTNWTQVKWSTADWTYIFTFLDLTTQLCFQILKFRLHRSQFFLRLLNLLLPFDWCVVHLVAQFEVTKWDAPFHFILIPSSTNVCIEYHAAADNEIPSFLSNSYLLDDATFSAD